jgi:hypothetical protein
MWHKEKSKYKKKKDLVKTRPKEETGGEVKRDENPIPLQPKVKEKQNVTYDFHVAVTKKATIVVKYVNDFARAHLTRTRHFSRLVYIFALQPPADVWNIILSNDELLWGRSSALPVMVTFLHC